MVLQRGFSLIKLVVCFNSLKTCNLWNVIRSIKKKNRWAKQFLNVSLFRFSRKKPWHVANTFAFIILLSSLGNCSSIVLSDEEWFLSKRREHHISPDNTSKTLHGGNIIICLVYNISVCWAGLNSSAFTLPNLATLSANDKHTTSSSILERYILPNIYKNNTSKLA